MPRALVKPQPRKAGAAAVRPDYLPFGQPDFSAKEIAAVTRVLRTGWVGMGREVLAFEGELSKAVGAAEVVTVSSCTDALFLALRVLGVGAGDEVIVPSMTWCSTANAALYPGATPVFCDVARATLCATPETVLAALTPRTKAVIVVHYGGQAIDVAALRAALPARVAIVEDAAHALGARYPSGEPVGSSGNLVCFSFYANKNLSTAEGGAIAVNDRRLAEHARSLRQHGLHRDAWQRFQNPLATPFHGGVHELGYKMNFTDLQAAIGRVQLKRQGGFAKHRLRIARVYERGLARRLPGFEPLAGQTEAAHARHLYVVRHPADARKSRDQLVMDLRAMNVGAAIHYAPLHQMAFYKAHVRGPLPVTDEAGGRILTLPIGARVTAKDAEYVLSAMERCL